MDDGEERLQRNAYLRQQLSPANLVGAMAAARERTPDYQYFKIGVACRQLGDGAGDLATFDRAAKAIEQDVRSDPEIAARLAALQAMGFVVYFGIYDEPWRRDLQINIIQDPDADRLLRRAAAMG